MVIILNAYIIECIFRPYIIMQNTAKVTGSRILEDRTSIKTFIAANNPIFNQKIAAIGNKEFPKIKELGIFEHRNDPTPHIFYYEASRYNSDLQNDIQDYIIKELNHHYNNFDCSYSIAYIHSSFVDFIVFRKLVEKWPEHFFQKLRKIYIVGASFIVKIIEVCSIGVFYRMCDELFLNVKTIEELKEVDTEQIKLIGQNPNVTDKPFKNSIKILVSDIYGKNVQNYDLYAGKYPIIILRLLRRLLARSQQLSIQGIFRKSCDSEQLQILQKKIETKQWSVIDNEPDVLVVCGCLKKILNNLRLPLFNYGIYQQVISFQGGDEIKFIKGLISHMEYVNHKLFTLLLVFLTDFIISDQEKNKMTGYNLSVVFGPCFFRPKQYDLKDLIYSGKYAKILVNCFQKQKEIIDQDERKFASSILQGLKDGSLIIDH